MVKRVSKGQGVSSDLVVLKDITNQIAGHTICPFGDALVTPVLSFMKKIS
jgi:NADH-quinone oxidoreductase subunit F